MAATGDLRWGIHGVTQRSSAVADQLAPQDGLFTVLTRSADGAAPGVNAAVRAVLPGATSRGGTVRLIAAPDVRIVTLTVTEKGYRHDPATGRLRREDPDVRADLDPGRAGEPVTVVGQLVRGLQRRMRDDAGPLTVVSCDNLPGNGAVLAGLVSRVRRPAARARGHRAARLARRLRPVPRHDGRPHRAGDHRRGPRRRRPGARPGATRASSSPSRSAQWVIEDSFAGEPPRLGAGRRHAHRRRRPVRGHEAAAAQRFALRPGLPRRPGRPRARLRRRGRPTPSAPTCAG